MEDLRKTLISLKIAGERGFILTPESCPWYQMLIDLHGWHEFAAVPIKPCYQFVIEFYTNLPFAENRDRVTVFGHEIDFSAEAINRAFNIPPLSAPDPLFGENAADHHLDREEVNQIITLGKNGERIRRAHTIKIGSLPVEAHQWRKFMTGRILGATKEGETSEEQQLILMYILIGRKFDVGRLINERIHLMRERFVARSGRKMALPFPSIITLLCNQVPRPEGAHELKNVQALRVPEIGEQGSESVLQYYTTHWLHRNDQGWVRPPFAPIPGTGAGTSRARQTAAEDSDEEIAAAEPEPMQEDPAPHPEAASTSRARPKRRKYRHVLERIDALQHYVDHRFDELKREIFEKIESCFRPMRGADAEQPVADQSATSAHTQANSARRKRRHTSPDE